MHERSLTGAERLAWLTLAMVPGVGPGRMRRLIEACGSATGVLEAPFAFLEDVPESSRALATAIGQASTRQAEQVLDQLRQLGGELLLPGDPGFPPRLAELAQPPLALFVLGRTELLSRPAVAIVGSRDHTPYGAEVCDALSAGAAGLGIVVVSGMARGLDAVAHRAALAAGGGTIGVLGNGLGVIYPAANRALYEAVARDGLLVTELPPGERPHAGAFPRRNRIIAGLARVTVVVEAAVGSGALITAGEALDLGRDVMAVPGPVTSATSVGPNQLLRDGAIALLDLADLRLRFPEASSTLPADRPDGPEPDSVPARILALLSAGPRHADELAATLRQPTGQVLALLGLLEIRGLVAQRPGMVYALARARFAAGAR